MNDMKAHIQGIDKKTISFMLHVQMKEEKRENGVFLALYSIKQAESVRGLQKEFWDFIFSRMRVSVMSFCITKEKRQR